MGVDYKITVANSTASTIFDLTDPSVNPEAAPTSTPRQGGYTLRNRVNFTNVATANKKLFTIVPATAATVGNVLRVLEVPERTLIKDVQVFAVKDETVPGATCNSGSSGGLHASTLAAAAIGIGVEQRSVPSSHASYNALAHLDLQLSAQRGMEAGAPFGNITLAKVGAGVDGCDFDASQVTAVDASIAAPELTRVLTEDVVSASVGGSSVNLTLDGVPTYFPYGGYVYIGMTNVATGSVTADNASLAGSMFVTPTGTWEFQADCTYVPE